MDRIDKEESVEWTGVFGHQNRYLTVFSRVECQNHIAIHSYIICEHKQTLQDVR